jgi:hypothetical protein
VNRVDRVTSLLKLVAIAENEASGEFTAVIEFRDIDGKTRRIEQPKSNLRKITALKEALENAGAYLSPDDRKNNNALRALSSSAKDAKRWKYASAVGWYDGHRAFVHPNGTIGKPRADALILPPRTPTTQQQFEFGCKGSYSQWLKLVAKPARYSSFMVLGICMALAAPLLDFLDFHSFGILLSAPSKSGKSTVLVAAGSVIGIPYEKALPNFRTTDTALGEVPAAFNDMVLLLNELALLKGNAKGRHESMRDFAYGFAEGHGTTYSKFVTHDNGNCNPKWRGLGFATGEETLDQIAAAAGESRAMGASIRWLDLRGNQRGAKDIFDRCPKEVSADERTKWVRQQCQALRQAAADNHGVAFVHYIERVIKRRRKIKGRLQPLIEHFVDAVVNQTNEPAVQHLASCFGLIRAAGILGAQLDILPYSEKFIDRCIMRCYRIARRGLRTETELLRSGLSRLRGKLKSPNIPTVVGKKQFRADALKVTDGYIDKSGSIPKVTIRAEKFKGWFDDARQPALVLRWLYSKKALLCKPVVPAKSGNAIVWAESQPEWPNGRRPRSIVIELGDGPGDQFKI